VGRDLLTFTIGKVLPYLVGECLGSVLDAGDHRDQRSTRNATPVILQRNRILETCRWPENRFCCLAGEVNDDVRRNRVEATTGDLGSVVLVGLVVASFSEGELGREGDGRMGLVHELVDYGFDEMRFSSQVGIMDSMIRASSTGM
jgi:hypothetical protein